MSADMERRWREAKLGDRRGPLVCVWVECEGDPRAEVLEQFAAPDPEPDAEHVHVAPNPPRRSRKRSDS